MRKTIVAATAAASIAAGALAGSVLGSPALAGAAETAGGAVGWVEEALGGLVDDGTIDQAQADAVETALDEARPERGFGHGGLGHGGSGHHGFGRHLDLATVAESLGVTQEEVRSAVEGGQTIAEVAGQEGVAVQAVVDAIVAAQEERVAEKVADGDLTQEQADEVLADAEERATAMVDGELPALRDGHGPDGGGRRHGSAAEEGTADDSADTDACPSDGPGSLRPLDVLPNAGVAQRPEGTRAVGRGRGTTVGVAQRPRPPRGSGAARAR